MLKYLFHGPMITLTLLCFMWLLFIYLLKFMLNFNHNYPRMCTFFFFFNEMINFITIFFIWIIHSLWKIFSLCFCYCPIDWQDLAWDLVVLMCSAMLLHDTFHMLFH